MYEFMYGELYDDYNSQGEEYLQEIFDLTKDL